MKRIGEHSLQDHKRSVALWTACLILVLLLPLFLALPISAGTDVDVIATCLDPCHVSPGYLGPDVQTDFLGSAEAAGHKMSWSARVVASTSGATLSQGSRMPCDECHVAHGTDNGSIYMFSTKRTDGAVVTTTRQLCEGCHIPYDSAEGPATVCGLVLRKLPYSVAAHKDSSSQDCFDCHGSTAHAPQGHGGPDCSACHGSDGSHAIHTDASDLRGPGGIACTDCHMADLFPTFKSGTDANGDGLYDLSETDVCDTCHSPGGSYDGVDSTAAPTGAISIGAKDNWDSQVYDTTSTVQSGKERWCAGCHDGDASTPGEEPSLIDGIYAPPVIGDEGDGYFYGTGWGYYETGHGLATDTAVPSSGGVAMGAGLECDSCHQYDLGHIDGVARTYDASVYDGGNMYRSGYRLVQVDIGAGPVNPMHLPWPQNDSLNSSRFALCTSCHDPDPYLGNNSDTNFVHNGTNEHSYHIGMTNYRFDSDWGGGYDSRISCPVCHNVHGTQRLVMMRDGTLVDREPGFEVWYANPAIVSNNWGHPDPPDPQNLTLLQSTGMIMLETSSTQMCSACHNRSFTSEYTRGALRWKGDKPVLDWMWIAPYLDRGINTDRIFDVTYDVPFRIKYFDPNNDAPTSMQVWIDLDDDGIYDPSEKVSMTKMDAGDTDYTDGASYAATVTATQPTDKDLIYRFYATDGTNTAVGSPVADQLMVWDDNLLRDVPSEYSSIQEAIDAAYEGNTIAVSDGTYAEGIDYLGKEITIYSVNGSASTTITGSGAIEPCVSFVSGETSVTLQGFTIDNIGPDDGDVCGILIENGSTPTVTDCLITGNRADVNANGGGIRIDGGGLTLTDTTITANWARRGGGLYAINTSQTITVTDCAIDGNTGFDYPGVYLNSCEATTTFTRTSISNNDGSGPGGGISCSSASIELYDCTVDDNDGGDATNEHGGGIRLTGGDSAAYIEGGSISGNYCGGQGGGIYITNTTAAEPLTIIGTDMSGNRCNNTGAGIFASGVTGTIRLDDVNLDDSSSNGGGSAIRADCPVVITDSSLNNCEVRHVGGGDHGGAIYLSGTNVSLSITNTPMNDCSSGQDGGALYLNGSTLAAPLQMTNIEIRNGYAASNGGSIYVSNCTNTSVLTSVTIDGCNSYTDGGGIWTNSSMTISDSQITNNWTRHTPEDGGGIYATGATTVLTITDTVVDDNSANNGAGIAFSGQQMDFTWGSISGNTSPGQYTGGGLRSSGTVSLYGLEIKGNTSGNGGTGVYLSSGTLAMTNCTVANNYGGTYYWASGAGVKCDGTLTMNACTVEGNYTSWAAGVQSGGTITNSSVWDNYSTRQSSTRNLRGGATVSYTNTRDGSYTDGGNNISSDPLYVSPIAPSTVATTAGDYHLQGTSPNEGSASALTSPPDDIDRGTRPQDTGDDMGSDEIGTVGASMAPDLSKSFTVESPRTGPGSEGQTQVTSARAVGVASLDGEMASIQPLATAIEKAAATASGTQEATGVPDSPNMSPTASDPDTSPPSTPGVPVAIGLASFAGLAVKELLATH